MIALTRQNLPTVRGDHTTKNLCAQGAYVLEEASASRKAIILASGSEVEIALQARKLLLEDGIGARVVSCPSLDVFAESFGASAPIKDLYEHFGTTAEAVAAKVRALVKG